MINRRECVYFESRFILNKNSIEKDTMNLDTRRPRLILSGRREYKALPWHVDR